MNPPNATDTTPESELRALARDIDTFRRDSGLTTVQLLARFPELGSDKTFSLFRKPDADLSELALDKWLAKYREVWKAIDGNFEAPEVPRLDDLAGPAKLCEVFLRTRRVRDNSRFVLILGDSGCGKTTTLDVLASKPYGLSNVLRTDAHAVWRDKKSGRGTDVCLLRDLLSKLGVEDAPSRRDQLLMEVVAKLQGRQRCIAIDEIHHLCPDGINLLKDLINMTPAIIVGAAMPELWDKLNSVRGGWTECKQLMRNRLAEKITLKLRDEDVAALIRSVESGWDDKQMKAATDALRAEAGAHGNLKFVVKSLTEYLTQVADGQQRVPSTLANAIAIERKRRS